MNVEFKDGPFAGKRQVIERTADRLYFMTYEPPDWRTQALDPVKYIEIGYAIEKEGEHFIGRYMGQWPFGERP